MPMMRIRNNACELLPGTLLTLAIAAPALWLHSLYTPISAVAIAMVAGMLLRNTIGLPKRYVAGTSFMVARVLRLAIILLGVRLSFAEVLQTGGDALMIILSCMTLAILVVHALCKLIKLPPRLGTLIGVGTAICGNSAIVATAPAINAEDEEVAFAVSTITLFGVIAVFLYPVLGHLLRMSDTTFGIWAGTAINDTSQVVTAGFIFGEPAGNAATVVKLTRNLFMAPVIVLFSILYNRKQTESSLISAASLKRAFPVFVLGFVGMVVLRTVGVFPPGAITVIKTVSGFFIVMAIAAVGLGTSFGAMKKVGFKPFYVGLAASIIMGGVSYALINLIRIK